MPSSIYICNIVPHTYVYEGLVNEYAGQLNFDLTQQEHFCYHKPDIQYSFIGLNLDLVH